MGNPNPVMAWKPGQSGNSSGIPRITWAIKKKALAWSREAIDELVKIMQTAAHPRDRGWAADKILDRALGKAAQSVEMTGSVSMPVVPIINISVGSNPQDITSLPVLPSVKVELNQPQGLLEANDISDDELMDKVELESK